MSFPHSQTGSQPNAITWSLTPETYPPPATPFFDIWIRNGVGSMYTPSLNVRSLTPLPIVLSLEETGWLTLLPGQLRLAAGVDALASNSFEVTDAQKFIPGIGCQSLRVVSLREELRSNPLHPCADQLFFADPANPETVYCDSDIFAIGTDGGGDAGAMSPSSTTDAPEASATSATPSSADCATSTTGAAGSPSDSATSTAISTAPSDFASPSLSSSPFSPSASPSRSQGKSRITAAPAPGGPDEQGFNLLPSGAGRAAISGAAALFSLLLATLAWP